ncbi:MAG: 7-cyano-7-deazaguanine synthase QueC [Hyphomonadaceae bacterium]
MSECDRKAIVLFSGGQDSTVCLVWALDHYDTVETIGFTYGQRHAVELECRLEVLKNVRVILPEFAPKLGADHVSDISALGALSDTALTREKAIEVSEAGLPSTFVPARNLVFLTLAAAFAWRRGSNVLVGGMCETDFSGYPDCRRKTIDAQAKALSLGLDKPVQIETPLMYLDKAQTWDMAEELGGEPLVDLIIEDTHTCYLGRRDKRHDWGYGCGECPACELRKAGWRKWQESKPT